MNYSGLESGHHLRNEKATRRNINLDKFEGRVIGTGKADAQNLEEHIQGKVNYYKSQLERNYEISPEELENELTKYEKKLRENLKDKNEFVKTHEFKKRIDKID